MIALLRTFFLALKNSIVVFFIVRLFILPVTLLVVGGLLAVIFDRAGLTSNAIEVTIVITSVAVILLLVILFIRETAKLHTLRKRSRRNINLFVAVVYLTFAGGVYYVFFADKLKSTYESPCGDGYTASIYTKPRFFAMPGDGGVGSSVAFVVVRNRWGWPIAKSNDDCGVFYYDIEISWDCERHELYFAQARSLNLLTGECEY